MKGSQSRRAWALAVSSVIALGVVACSDPVEPPAPAPSATVVAELAPSASAAPRPPPAGCPKLVEALGLRRGFPVLAPQSKAELDAAVAELELRIQSFQKVQSELDPESQSAGAAVSGTFADFVAMMRRKTPPPSAPAAPGAQPGDPRADIVPGLETASAANPLPRVTAPTPIASVVPRKKKAPGGAAASASAEPLYDTSEWSAVNDRFVDAWRTATALCAGR